MERILFLVYQPPELVSFVLRITLRYTRAELEHFAMLVARRAFHFARVKWKLLAAILPMSPCR